MIKKNTLVATITIILSACASQTGISPYSQSVNAAADAIPAEKQTGYFLCKFQRDETPCRQKIWQTHPNPKLERDLTRETVKDFLAAVEERGAGHIMDAEGKKCGKPQDLSQRFWKPGYEITCADGKHYSIERENDQWRITPLPEEKGGENVSRP